MPHPPDGRLAGDGDVAAQPDQHPAAGGRARRISRHVGGECLRGCTEVELRARRQPDAAALLVESHDRVARDRLDPDGLIAERRVDVMRDEHLSDRWVDGTVGQPRRPQRLTHCIEQQLADHHVLARGLVEQREFGVLTEVRAAEVERRHRALDARKRGRQARAFGHRYDRLAAPERELGPAECLRCGGRGQLRASRDHAAAAAGGGTRRRATAEQTLAAAAGVPAVIARAVVARATVVAGTAAIAARAG